MGRKIEPHVNFCELQKAYSIISVIGRVPFVW